MAAIYPPERHLLRDLRFTFDERDDLSLAWLPVVPEVCTDDGSVRAGALATLVDVIGGGVAARAAQPDWIATADLTLHVAHAVHDGAVEARGRVLRAGRTTVVIEVMLHHDGDASDQPVGIATMSFSVLPRRDTNPDVGAVRTPGPSTMALEASRLDAPLLDALGLRVVDAARGVVEVPVSEWSLNSMGATQGGVVATIVEAAAEAALRAATGRPLVVTDLQMTYLAFGKVGPLRTSVEVLDANDHRGVARVELVDTGGGGRRMTIARAVATRPPA